MAIRGRLVLNILVGVSRAPISNRTRGVSFFGLGASTLAYLAEDPVPLFFAVPYFCGPGTASVGSLCSVDCPAPRLKGLLSRRIATLPAAKTSCSNFFSRARMVPARGARDAHRFGSSAHAARAEPPSFISMSWLALSGCLCYS